MALINYVEPATAELPGIIVAFGVLAVLLVFAWIIYRIYKRVIVWMDSLFNREEKYDILEEVMLDKIAKEKGINLDMELMKRDMLRKPKSKYIRKRIKDQVYEEFFGKEDSSKKI